MCEKCLLAGVGEGGGGRQAGEPSRSESSTDVQNAAHDREQARLNERDKIRPALPISACHCYPLV